MSKQLFCDMKTDEDKYNFFLSGRGCETGVIAQAIQNDVAMAYHRCHEYTAELTRLRAELAEARENAERWKWIRRKLCLIGNGDGTCSMHAINLPAANAGWPEGGRVAEFCDGAIDAAIAKEES